MIPDLTIIGSGPAGLAAARAAVECGGSVLVIDDNAAAGGQIWRGTECCFEHPRVEYRFGVRVVDAPEPGRLLGETCGERVEIPYRKLLLATGARELFLPFPGWTLPNVMGAGGLQALVKGGLPIEGKRIVVAGSGPLLLAVAAYLRGRGAEIAVLAEQASARRLLPFALGLLEQPSKLVQGFLLRRDLLGVRFRNGVWPVRAIGSGRVERVVLTDGESRWTESCDYLACGFGLVPNLELPNLMGCRIDNGVVEVAPNQRTSVENVFAAGELTGIGGVDLSQFEGQAVGYAAMGDLSRLGTLAARLASARRFSVRLEKAFSLRPELGRMAEASTIVCRCEDVPYGRLVERRSWSEAKLHTRCGMGPCQGRICGAATEQLFGWQVSSPRPPVFPVSVELLRSRSAESETSEELVIP